MNGYFKTLVAAALVAVTCSPFAFGGPIGFANDAKLMRRQDASDSASISTSTLPDPSPSTSSDVPISSTFSDVPISSTSSDAADVSTLPVSEVTVTPSSTVTSPETSFTPFTGTFASAPPLVTEVGSYASANPDIYTMTFSIIRETSTPACNVLKCPLSTTTTVPVFGSSTPNVTGGPAATPTFDVTFPSEGCTTATVTVNGDSTGIPEPTTIFSFTDPIQSFTDGVVPTPTESVGAGGSLPLTDGVPEPTTTTTDSSATGVVSEPTEGVTSSITDGLVPESTDGVVGGSASFPQPTETLVAGDPTSSDA